MDFVQINDLVINCYRTSFQAKFCRFIERGETPYKILEQISIAELDVFCITFNINMEFVKLVLVFFNKLRSIELVLGNLIDFRYSLS
jgi:hypothetical protein